MGKKTLAALLLIAFFSSFVSLAHAQDVNLLDLPEQVATYFGIDVFSAGILVSTIALILGIVVVGYIVRSKGTFPAILMTGIGLMSFFVAVGWLPVWLLTVVVLLIALLVSDKIKGLFG